MTAKIDNPSKSGRTNSLSIKAAGMIFAGLLLVTASVNIFTASIVGGEISAVGAAWTDYETRDAPKMRIIGQLRGTLGYGGMIHELKNYVLRGGAQQLATVRSKIDQAKGLIADYGAHGVNRREDGALADLERTIDLYDKAAGEAESMVARGETPREIDRLVMLDDEAALLALDILDLEHSAAHDASTQRVYETVAGARQTVTKVEVITVTLFAAMFLFFMWHLIYRVIRPLSELGEAMKSLAAGDLEVRIPALGRRDEIGDMAATMEVFQETAISRLWAEEALRVGETRLDLFIKHTPVAIAMFDADMCYMMCSKQWLDEYGLTDSEIIGRSHYELLPDTPEYRKEIFRHGLSGGGRISEEDLIHHSDAGSAWTRWIVEPWRKKDGEIGGIIVISEDITERKRAESALRESEGRLAATQQIAKLGHWELDIPNAKMRASREIALMIGEEDEDMVISCADYRQRVHPYDRDHFDRVLKVFRETREPYDMDYRIISKQGEIRVLHDKGEFRPGEDGKPEKVIGMVQDITDLTRAQESARESEAKIRLIVENVADGIITINEKGIVDSFFGAAETIFGYTAEEVIGENISMLMPEPFHSEHQGYLAAYVKGRGSGLVGGVGREITGRRKDGVIIPLELIISELQQNGQRQFVGTLRDISEKKLIEQRMRESNRLEAIGELAGGVAHDFNNLLMVINGFAKRAVANMDNKTRLEESLAEVIKSADRGATLTHQLLMFGRRELLESRVFRVSEQINDYKPLLQTLLGETISLNVEIEDDQAYIKTDPSELYQAIVNLAVNSRDAMPDGGTLTIRVETVQFDETRALITPNASVGDYVRVSVSDSGYGMDGDTLSRVFEPFFTTKEQGKGTGLGLALVYGFIKQSGGIIEVDSSPGDGTTFVLYFPAVDRQPLTEAPKSTTQHTSNNETILLAEDDDALRMLAREILEDHGYHVLVARDGVETLELEDSYAGTIHLLITDVVMPGLSGFDVAEALRQSRPQTKVVFMSGYPARGQIQSVDIPDDAPFLQKPFLPEKLVEMVRETLAAAPTSEDQDLRLASGA